MNGSVEYGDKMQWDHSHLNRHVNHLRAMNPSSTAPTRVFCGKAARNSFMCSSYDPASAGLAFTMQAVNDHEPLVDKSWDMDPDSPEAMEILKQAIHTL